MRVGVLGGGALGLTTAYRLAGQGHQVVIFERGDRVGGLAVSFEVGGSHLEKFYHHIFKSDRVIVDLIGELGLAQDLHWGRPRTANLWRGERLALDSVPAVLGYSPLPFFDRLRLGAGVAFLKLSGDHRRFERSTAAEWTRRWMGKQAYEVVLEPLLRAKFGENYRRIAMPWLWSRFHERTMSLGYLRGGFHRLYARLAERIADLGGEIILGREVVSVGGLPDERVRVLSRPTGSVAEPTEDAFDAVVATMPTRLFVKLAEGLPADYRARYDWGEHYGAHCLVLGLDRQLMSDNTYWLSVMEPGYPFLAAVEHTNYMPTSDYAGLHLVYLGNYLPMGDPLFGLSKEEVLARFTPFLRRINPEFDTGWVRELHAFQAPFAQPIVTLDYHEHIPPLETPIPNLYLANMFQVYPQDRGQNYSIKLANEVVRLVTGGSSRGQGRVILNVQKGEG